MNGPTRSTRIRKASPRLGTGSELIVALERAWEQIRANVRTPDGDTELPKAMIVTGSGLQSSGVLAWAHFMPEAWKVNDQGEPLHELFVSAERLATGAELTLQSMLHEAAHFLAHLRGIQDTSRGKAYHNREFLKLAEELGLEYVHDGPSRGIGFSAVTLSDMARVYYGETLAHLESAIRASANQLDNRAGTVDLLGASLGVDAGAHTLKLPKAARAGLKGTGGGSKVKLECGCGRKLWVGRHDADEGGISCQRCAEDFSEV